MNKSELIQQLSDRTGLAKADATRAFDALFDDGGIIADALKQGEKVTLTPFGTFEPRHRAARKGRNPQTGQEIDIGASTSVGFRVGKRLKDALGS
jgi:DNA-binding protein HU-beta